MLNITYCRIRCYIIWITCRYFQWFGFGPEISVWNVRTVISGHVNDLLSCRNPGNISHSLSMVDYSKENFKALRQHRRHMWESGANRQVHNVLLNSYMVFYKTSWVYNLRGKNWLSLVQRCHKLHKKYLKNGTICDSEWCVLINKIWI